MRSTTCEPVDNEQRQKWRMFCIGLAFCLLGLLLLWISDGYESGFRKGLIVVGGVLSIGGITVLRYLLFSGFRREKRAKQNAKAAPAGPDTWSRLS